MEIGLLQVTENQHWASEWSRYARYAGELLAHAGLPYRPVSMGQLAQELERVFALVIPSHAVLNEDALHQITRFAEAGGVVIGLGGTSGLEALFGCLDRGRIAEAWVAATGVPHPALSGVTGPLHAFGGRKIEVAGAGVQVLAQWLDPDRWREDQGWTGAEIGPAVTVRRVGAGWALLVAADLVHSVLRIQQGRPIHVDGRPALDGSAPVNDGILKTDDGLVLDYERDRVPVAHTRFFGRPIADEWREVLIRSILWAGQVTGTPIPMLWYWPDLLPAVGQISHDSDMNDPRRGELQLEAMQRLEIPSTWCIQYPGGYAPDFYKRLHKAGYEIALHYDARTNVGRTFWQEADFCLQLDWLQDMAGVPIVSNKNHYLRWEGLTEFFVWLERRGIRSDQSKGPSKTGNKGFPFGGSHPWFPLDEHTLRTIDVLEVNLHSQDLVLTCPYEVGPVVIDQARARFGVAHLLFHPAHVDKPGIADAMGRAVRYGQQLGLAWWTNARIQAWERARRQVRLTLQLTEDGARWVAESPASLAGATFLLFDPVRAQRTGVAAGSPGANGQPGAAVGAAGQASSAAGAMAGGSSGPVAGNVAGRLAPESGAVYGVPARVAVVDMAAGERVVLQFAAGHAGATPQASAEAV